MRVTGHSQRYGNTRVLRGGTAVAAAGPTCEPSRSTWTALRVCVLARARGHARVHSAQSFSTNFEEVSERCGLALACHVHVWMRNDKDFWNEIFKSRVPRPERERQQFQSTNTNCCGACMQWWKECFLTYCTHVGCLYLTSAISILCHFTLWLQDNLGEDSVLFISLHSFDTGASLQIMILCEKKSNIKFKI